MTTAARALLAGLIDYAGLFPPAALDMDTAVRNYAEYRADPRAWMLGRFVVPVARLDEFAEARGAITAQAFGVWPVSALLGTDGLTDVARVRAFNRAQAGRSSIDSLEGLAREPGAVERLAGAVGDAGGAGDLELFVEVGQDGDPAPVIAAIRRAGVHAKIRMGGVVPGSIPSAPVVARFMRSCIDAGVAFKATAGLHHPIRGEYPLTYEAGAATAVMHGYLNVLVACALMLAGTRTVDAVDVLEERDAGAFEIANDRIAWRGRAVGADVVERLRSQAARSIGSCSFREPVDELRLAVPAA